MVNFMRHYYVGLKLLNDEVGCSNWLDNLEHEELSVIDTLDFTREVVTGAKIKGVVEKGVFINLSETGFLTNICKDKFVYKYGIIGGNNYVLQVKHNDSYYLFANQFSYTLVTYRRDSSKSELFKIKYVNDFTPRDLHLWGRGISFTIGDSTLIKINEDGVFFDSYEVLDVNNFLRDCLNEMKSMGISIINIERWLIVLNSLLSCHNIDRGLLQEWVLYFLSKVSVSSLQREVYDILVNLCSYCGKETQAQLAKVLLLK